MSEEEPSDGLKEENRHEDNVDDTKEEESGVPDEQEVEQTGVLQYKSLPDTMQLAQLNLELNWEVKTHDEVISGHFHIKEKFLEKTIPSFKYYLLSDDEKWVASDIQATKSKSSNTFWTTKQSDIGKFTFHTENFQVFDVIYEHSRGGFKYSIK